MQSERSLSELTMDLAAQAGDLIRNEIKLARAEAIESVKRMGGGIIRAALGVVVAGAALTLALFALAYGLSTMMPMWLAALTGALIGAVVAYVLIKSGLKAASVDHIALPKTAEQMSRDIRLIKETTSS